MPSSRELIAKLKRAGWIEVRQRGSHVQLRSPDGARRTTVPHPKKDLKRGLVAAIERQTGIRFDEGD